MTIDQLVVHIEDINSVIITDELGSTAVAQIEKTDTVVQTASQGPQGIKGDTGDKGDKGDKGDPGPLGQDVHYTHIQAIPSDTWTITHNLSKRPSVAIVDSSGSLVEGEIQYIDGSSLIAQFGAGFSGTAYLN